MPDYGHPLRFGSFITPVNAPAAQPVRLAVLSEELGFDLVTFQDHPYQASFLDTWTLLSWVGAQTERVQLSGNVLNLPLRQPAVLARGPQAPLPRTEQLCAEILSLPMHPDLGPEQTSRVARALREVLR